MAQHLLLGTCVVALSGCLGSANNAGQPRVMSDDMRAALERIGSRQNAQGPVKTGEAPPQNQPKGFVQLAKGESGETLVLGQNTSAQSDRSGGIILNFAGADLRGVVDNILGERLGVNYMVEDGVDGKVTLQTNRPLSQPQMLTVLQEILAMNGAELVNGSGVYRVRRVSSKAASQPFSFQDAARRGAAVHVTPLAYADPDAVSRMLKNIVPSSGLVEVDKSRNLVFSVGSPAEQRAIADVIGVIDADFMQDMAFALLPLKEARPETVISEVEALIASSGAANAVQMIAIERLNGILVMARSNRALGSARAWIERLDQGTGEGEQLFVYPVKNRRAENLARIIGDVFSVQAIYDAPQDSAIAPDRTGTTFVSTASGSASTSSPIGASSVGSGGQGGALTQTANAGQRRYQRPGLQPGTRAAQPQSNVRVIADTETNALIIYASHNDYKPIKSALDRMDVLPVQVLIEATLLEVRLSNDLEFGVRWFFETGNSQFDFTDVADAGVSPASSGFNYVLDTNDARVVLSALREVTDVEFLSAPNMMVMDNQVARLQVGDEVPVQTRSSVSTIDPNAPIVNDIEYRSTGVILSVRPKVTNDGLVVMDVTQEVSDVVRTVTSGIVSPTIQQRRFDSTVAIASGETVILGGLTSRSTTYGRTGVPVLSSIPLIGNAFSSRSNSRDRTELLVMITPRVIRDQRAARAATEEMRTKLYNMFAPVPSQQDRVINPMKTLTDSSADISPRPVLDAVLTLKPKPPVPDEPQSSN